MTNIKLILASLLTAISLFAPAASYADKMEFAVQDDAAIVGGGDDKRQSALAAAKDLGADWVRINIYSWHDLSYYDAGIRQTVANGFKVQLTIDCSKKQWSAESYFYHARSVAARYKDAVSRYSICNEPNYPGWLEPIPDKSLAKTYRDLYIAGVFGIKSAQQESEVFIGELSSKHDPIEFLKGTLCLENGELKCQKMFTDGVAYHPYQQTIAPTKDSPKGQVGIGSLDELNKALTQAYEKGALASFEDKKPNIYLTEFGYQSRAREKTARLNLPPAIRAEWLSDSFHVACKTPNVKQMLQYQLLASSPYWPGTWDTSIIDHSGQPDAAYYELKRWVSVHPSCIK